MKKRNERKKAPPETTKKGDNSAREMPEYALMGVVRLPFPKSSGPSGIRKRK